MTDDGRILVDRNGHIALVTIDRAAKANVLTAHMVAEFAEATAMLEADADVRVLVITGAGEQVFCGGGDLKTWLPAAMEARTDVTIPDPTRRVLSDVFKPVVAAVRGACLGAGLDIMLGSDLRIVSADATFGLPEARLALIPGGGSHLRLPRQVPWAIAMEMVLTGKILDANRAREVGLVNEVVDGSQVLERAMDVAAQLAAGGPIAMRTSKEIAVRGLAMESGFALEHALNSRVLGSADAREGVRAFLAKQPAVFTGE